MAYDEGLAERIRGVLGEEPGVSEKRMFGGVAFLVGGRMSVGIVQDKLMVRVGPESYDRVLKERHARQMDFTGRPMKGFIYVVPSGYESDADLERWVCLGVGFAESLPKGRPAVRARAKPGSSSRRTGTARPPARPSRSAAPSARRPASRRAAGPGARRAGSS